MEEITLVCKAEKLAGELSFENMSRLNDNGMLSVHYHNAYEIYYKYAAKWTDLLLDWLAKYF